MRIYNYIKQVLLITSQYVKILPYLTFKIDMVDLIFDVNGLTKNVDKENNVVFPKVGNVGISRSTS